CRSNSALSSGRFLIVYGLAYNLTTQLPTQRCSVDWLANSQKANACPSILSSLTKHKTSVSLSCDFSLLLEQVNQTASSSLATWVNASSNNPSHGERWGSIFADARGHCISIIGRHTRSEHRPTVCLGLSCLMSMELPKNGSARFRCSTVRFPVFKF